MNNYSSISDYPMLITHIKDFFTTSNIATSKEPIF